MKTKCKETRKSIRSAHLAWQYIIIMVEKNQVKRDTPLVPFSWNSKIETLDDWERYSCNVCVGWRDGSGLVHSPNNKQAININSACKAHKMPILRLESWIEFPSFFFFLRWTLRVHKTWFQWRCTRNAIGEDYLILFSTFFLFRMMPITSRNKILQTSWWCVCLCLFDCFLPFESEIRITILKQNKLRNGMRMMQHNERRLQLTFIRFSLHKSNIFRFLFVDETVFSVYIERTQINIEK